MIHDVVSLLVAIWVAELLAVIIVLLNDWRGEHRWSKPPEDVPDDMPPLRWRESGIVPGRAYKVKR